MVVLVLLRLSHRAHLYVGMTSSAVLARRYAVINARLIKSSKTYSEDLLANESATAEDAGVQSIACVLLALCWFHTTCRNKQLTDGFMSSQMAVA